MNMLFENLGALLKKGRIKNKLSQKNVADALGYGSAQFVSNFERGLCSPPLNKLRILIDLYKLNPKKVMNIIMDEQEKFLAKNLNLSTKKKSRDRRESA